MTNRVVPGKIILGALGDIEAGVRQMIRTTPLEVREAQLPSGSTLRIPTLDEMLRIKGFLAVRRNQARDYVDVAALADLMGIEEAARVLANIDRYFADQRGEGDGVAARLARQLAEPRPRDARTTRQLGSCKNLDARWATWVTSLPSVRA